MLQTNSKLKKRMSYRITSDNQTESVFRIKKPTMVKKLRIKDHKVDPLDLGSSDLRGMQEKRKDFSKEYPEFKTGVTPVRSLNSMLGSEELNQIRQEADAMQKQMKLFKRPDYENVYARQNNFEQLMNVTTSSMHETPDIQSIHSSKHPESILPEIIPKGDGLAQYYLA